MIDKLGKTNQQRIEDRLKGYSQVPNGIYYSLRTKQLTSGEMILWLFSWMVLCDWDSSHINTFGTFNFSYSDIANFIGIDRSTVAKQASKLFELGLWVRRSGDNRITVVGSEYKKKLVGLTKELGVIELQNLVEFSKQSEDFNQHGIEKFQQNHPKEDHYLSEKSVDYNQQAPSTLYGSFKDDVTCVGQVERDVIPDTLLTDEEDYEIYRWIEEGRTFRENVKGAAAND